MTLATPQGSANPHWRTREVGMEPDVGHAVVQVLTAAKTPWVLALFVGYLGLGRVLLHLERRWEYLPPKRKRRRTSRP
jgi:hypothetical protein